MTLKQLKVLITFRFRLLNVNSNIFFFYLDYLLYGRLFIPTGRLEAVYSRRFSQWMQCVVTAVNDPRSKAASHVMYIL